MADDPRHPVRAFDLGNVPRPLQQMNSAICLRHKGVPHRQDVILPSPDDLRRAGQAFQGSPQVKGLSAIGEKGGDHFRLTGA